jgi:preprotein translocase subunit SecB
MAKKRNLSEATPKYPAAQSSTTPDLLGHALFPLQLTKVRLYDLRVERPARPRGASSAKEPRLETQVRLALVRKSVVGQLEVDLAFPNAEAPEYRLHLTLEGMLAPASPSTPPPTKDQLDKRLACTLLTLLWPYARELAQDLMRRMEVEAFPLPTLAIQDLHKTAESAPKEVACAED